MRSGRVMVLVLVTMMALLVAPVCAPLCAAGGCASGARVEACHDMAEMAAGGEGFTAASKACGNADLSAVLVRMDEQNLRSTSGRSESAAVALRGTVVRGLGSLHRGAARGLVHWVRLEAGDSSSLGTILRI
jgi:hypothetical protein